MRRRSENQIYDCFGCGKWAIYLAVAPAFAGAIRDDLMSEQLIRTAEHSATTINVVEHTPQPATSRNAEFEGLFSNRERNPHLGWNPVSKTIRTYEFANVVLDGAFRGLFNSNGFIHGTGYLVPEEQMATIQVDGKRLTVAASEGASIIGCNCAHDNYFHWITQALPTIDHAVNRSGRSPHTINIVLPILNSWQEESLQLLDLAPAKRVTISDCAKQHILATAEFDEILCGGAAFALSQTTRNTYSRLRDAVARPPAGDRKIYVARSDAPTRQMLNEPEIIDEVTKRGFEVLAPGALSVAEQISMFRGACVVMGAHGAGMTNIVFCEPGTAVYELLPSHYANPCFCNLAHICDLRYWADAFVSDGEGLPNLRHWTSDTNLVIARLDELEAVVQRQANSRTISAIDFLRGMPGRVIGVETPRPQPPSARVGIFRRLVRRLFG